MNCATRLRTQGRGVIFKRYGALHAGALSVLLALGGCGGGGGSGGSGGSAGGSPASFSYPSSLATATSTNSVGGVVAPYALDPNPTTPQLNSIPLNLFAVGSTTGKLTFTVSAIPLPSGAVEPSFVVTFDPANSLSTVANSPLGGLGCPGCLKIGRAPATGGGPSAVDVTFTYVDPASPAFSLKHSALGIWSKPTTVSSSNWQEVGGAFSGGVLTRVIDLPVTGHASYDGYFIGRYATSDPSFPPVGIYLAGAKAHVEVDFNSGVTFTISSTNISGETSAGLDPPILVTGLDLTTTAMPINRSATTSTSFVGTPTTSGFVTGEIKGNFYGPPDAAAPYAPPELGGSLAVSSSTQSMIGSFVLKKQ
jgi:hypothetical protein